MVALIAALNHIADWKNIYEKLAEMYWLDLVFDLCKILDIEDDKSSEYTELIIEAFKVSVQCLQPMIGLKLFYKYDLMLLVHAADLAPFLI